MSLLNHGSPSCHPSLCVPTVFRTLWSRWLVVHLHDTSCDWCLERLVWPTAPASILCRTCCICRLYTRYAYCFRVPLVLVEREAPFPSSPRLKELISSMSDHSVVDSTCLLVGFGSVRLHCWTVADKRVVLDQWGSINEWNTSSVKSMKELFNYPPTDTDN